MRAGQSGIGRRHDAWPNRSIFDGETLPDFIDPPVEGIEPCVQASVVKVEYVPASQKSENPVMRFHIEQHLLDGMTDSNYNVPQDVHRIPRSKREDYHDRKLACSGPQPFAIAANQSTVVHDRRLVQGLSPIAR